MPATSLVPRPKQAHVAIQSSHELCTTVAGISLVTAAGSEGAKSEDRSKVNYISHVSLCHKSTLKPLMFCESLEASCSGTSSCCLSVSVCVCLCVCKPSKTMVSQPVTMATTTSALLCFPGNRITKSSQVNLLELELITGTVQMCQLISETI